MTLRQQFLLPFFSIYMQIKVTSKNLETKIKQQETLKVCTVCIPT